MDKTSRLIQELVEALMEYGPGHEAIGRGIEWLAVRNEMTVDARAARVPRTECENCGEEFFWGNRFVVFQGTSQVKWVPICPIPVRSGDVVLDAVGLDWNNPVNPKYPIIVDAGPGLQWVPHSVLCGMTSRPLDPDLGDIWDQTAGTLVHDKEEVIAGLLLILDDDDD